MNVSPQEVCSNCNGLENSVQKAASKMSFSNEVFEQLQGGQDFRLPDNSEFTPQTEFSVKNRVNIRSVVKQIGDLN